MEQAAFSPANVVPGIGFSPDQMLQARLFSYGDTQFVTGSASISIISRSMRRNARFMSYHRDGAMRVDGNLGGTDQLQPEQRGRYGTNQPDVRRAAAADRG